ncbi:MAG: hemolysin family protein [Lachnospiraceae bacterium]|nr:hemolysin family protein [Lachnospiraceae bacterium]MDD7027077.1 hemolysin family protein [Lachnospiraceae bacterium]
MDDGGPTVKVIMVVLVVLLVELCLYIIAKMVKQYRAKNKEGSDAQEEIMSMIQEGHEQGLIQASEAKMITNIFEFDDKQAQDIMTHRSNIVAIDGKVTLDQAIGFMLEQRNSRYPVYEENIDHILGILHLKDALRMQYKNQNRNEPVGSIPGLLREAKFIPETRKVDALFATMQATKLQMVIVVDEYGQTSGLVALEDILEEIVGSILDEYDEEEEHIAQTSKDQYIIEGLTPLKELEERFGISFEEEEFETLNGFLIAKMDRIPEEKDEFSIDVGDYNFKVASIEHKRIQSVLVTKRNTDRTGKEEGTKN